MGNGYRIGAKIHSQPEVIPLLKYPQTSSDAEENQTQPHQENNDNGSSYADDGVVKLVTPRFSFSPADSLDSNVTLVSGAVDENLKPTSHNALPQNSEKREGGEPKVKGISRNSAKGITEKFYDDGTVEYCYANGNRKVISADGKHIKVYYYNGDVKETLANGLIKYFYSQSRTWHMTYPDKKEVLQFSK